jgi:MFS family permease
VSGIATFGRALPQAVLTPLLIARGLTYDGVIATQIVYMVVLSAAEFPSGLIADRVSRRNLYVASIGATALAYALVWFGTGLIVMMFAWAAYALGSALTTSTLDIHFAQLLRHDEPAFKRFFSKDRSIILVATMVGAFASSLLYPALGGGIYGVSLAAFAVAFIGGLLLLPLARSVHAPAKSAGDRGTEKQAAARGFLRTVRRDPRILRVILLGALTQVGLTPFFQLWQIVALEAHVAPSLFGAFFILSQVMSLLANVAFRHMTPSPLCTLGLLGLVATVGIAGLVTSKFSDVLLLCVLPFPLFLYGTQLEFTLQTIAPSGAMSSVVSFFGTASTVMSLLVLGALYWSLHSLPADLVLWCSVLCFAAASAALSFRFGSNDVKRLPSVSAP